MKFFVVRYIGTINFYNVKDVYFLQFDETLKNKVVLKTKDRSIFFYTDPGYTWHDIHDFLNDNTRNCFIFFATNEKNQCVQE
jgi:hypothetical protein